MEESSRRHVRVKPVGPYSRKLGPRIRELRKAQGWTQEHLAELADLLPHNVSRLEGAGIEPSLETVARLARAFEMTLGELYPDDLFGRASRLPGGTRRIGSNRPRRRRNPRQVTSSS